MGAHVGSHSTLHLDGSLVHFRIVGEVGLSAECTTLWQSHYQALVEVLTFGIVGDGEDVAYGGWSLPFDVGIALHLGHFGSHSAHNVTAYPAFAGCVLYADSLFYGPWVGLDAAEVGREVDAVAIVAKEQLPSAVRSCSTVVAEDTHYRAIAQWEKFVLESRVIARAHYDGVATGVFDGAIGGSIAVNESCNAVGVGELNVVEAHELALPLAQAFGIGSQAGDCGRDGVDVGRTRKSVELSHLFKGFQWQERSFPHILRFIIFGVAELLERVVFAHPVSLEAYNHFLTDAIGVEEAGAVNRDGNGSRIVLNDKALVDIARLVAADYATCYHEVFIDGSDIVGIVLPILCLEVGYGDVGHAIGFRHHHRRGVEIVATTAQQRYCCKEQQSDI